MLGPHNLLPQYARNESKVSFRAAATAAAAAKLLNGIIVTGVAGINRLASGKSFVLAMVKTDAIFAQLPTEVYFLVVNARGKIQQAGVEVLDDPDDARRRRRRAV